MSFFNDLNSDRQESPTFSGQSNGGDAPGNHQPPDPLEDAIGDVAFTVLSPRARRNAMVPASEPFRAVVLSEWQGRSSPSFPQTTRRNAIISTETERASFRPSVTFSSQNTRVSNGGADTDSEDQGLEYLKCPSSDVDSD